MPRDIPLGNGKLLICFDNNHQLRDLYFPHVGQENHLGGSLSRTGIWLGGQFSWIKRDNGWSITQQYQNDTLVSSVVFQNDRLQVRISYNEAVDFNECIFLRKITVSNLAPTDREIRLFFHHDFNILGNSVGDTAAVDPQSGGIIHYKQNRYFLINGIDDSESIHQVAVGRKNSGQHEGTYKDAEDGSLSGNPISQGSVDSTIALRLTVEKNSDKHAAYWLCAGKDWQEVHRLDQLVKHKGIDQLISRSKHYWRLWVRKETPVLDALSGELQDLYHRSLLILRTQIDSAGGILAANDSDVIEFNRDTYSYIWPRDGALVANALDRAGYPVPAQNFFRFISKRLTDDGYLLHKYNPDGSLASSWHPWTVDGQEQLPIQEDETALVIWALWEHFVLYRDIEFIKPLYRSLVKRGADFLCSYRDSRTGLPDLSYDLWEERRGILSFTVGSVFGGLTAASLFCFVFGELDKAQEYRQAAAQMRDGASEYLWRPELNRFCRMINFDDNGDIQVDDTLDMSLWGLFAFGLFEATDPRVKSTMEQLRDKLWIPTPIGGMARYEDDYYHRISNDLPGNPWFICTLWYGDYLIELSKTKEQLEEVMDILHWVDSHKLASGVLAEQVHPFTGKPLSVSPLTWSHATFVSTCRHLLSKLGQMQTCPECGHPQSGRQGKDDWIETLYKKECDLIHGICEIT